MIFGSFTGAIIFCSLVLAVLVYEDEFDTWDRVIMAGLGASMLLTTPALWMADSPFNGWSFYVSRGFLAAFCLKRFAFPVFLKFLYHRRENRQILESGRRLVDRRKHWL